MKHKKFTMIVALVLVVALAAGLGIWATGEEKLPTVTYYDGNDGNNARFAFTNTGKGSATDLFANFSNCMPGDSLTQTICVKADSANGAQGAKVYLRAEIDARAEALLQIRQQRRAVRARKVHLVDEEERRYAVALQQPPERAGVALHAVRAADDKDRVVEHLQGALCFGGEIDVARRIEQRDVRAAAVEHRLLGKDGDAALALERFGVQKGVAVIDAAERAQRARGI